MVRLLITIDYELFGSGEGDVSKCLLEPSEKLMSICEQHRSRLTFFVDVAELWRRRRIPVSKVDEEDWSVPQNDIERQLRDTVARGHDVQLHLHPQLLAVEDRDDCEEYHPEWWRLPALQGNGTVTIRKVVELGRKTLEELVRPAEEEYRCRAFRAGAWSIQPEERVIPSLVAAGMEVDTTVAPGCKCLHGLGRYSFAAVDEWMWRVGSSIDLPEEEGELLEVPIFTSRLSVLGRVVRRLVRSTRQGLARPEACSRVLQGDVWSFGERLDHLLERVVTNRTMFNVTGSLASDMKAHIRCALEMSRNSINPESRQAHRPVVAIGHAKSFGNPREFERFLTWCQRHTHVTLDSIDHISFWQAVGDGETYRS